MGGSASPCSFSESGRLSLTKHPPVHAPKASCRDKEACLPACLSACLDLISPIAAGCHRRRLPCSRQMRQVFARRQTDRQDRRPSSTTANDLGAGLGMACMPARPSRTLIVWPARTWPARRTPESLLGVEDGCVPRCRPGNVTRHGPYRLRILCTSISKRRAAPSCSPMHR